MNFYDCLKFATLYIKNQIFDFIIFPLKIKFFVPRGFFTQMVTIAGEGLQL